MNLALPVVLTALVALASRSAPRATHASTHPRAAATASSHVGDDADASGEASKHGSCEDGDRDGSDVGMGVCCMPASRRYASTYRDDGQSDGSVKAGGQTYSAEDELEADMRDGRKGGRGWEEIIMTTAGEKKERETEHQNTTPRKTNPKP